MNNKKVFHIPVLLKEVIEYLNLGENKNFIDCTVGFSGHTKEILKRTSPNGRLLGIDLDEKNLLLIEKKKRTHYDKGQDLYGYSMDSLFAYRFSGKLNELKYNKDEIIELQWWGIDKIFNLNEEEKKLFVPITISDEILDILKEVKNII